VKAGRGITFGDPVEGVLTKPESILRIIFILVSYLLESKLSSGTHQNKKSH
jgi:hypothetical protein